jgi:uncharacterized protein YfbU (UPF0304 family)
MNPRRITAEELEVLALRWARSQPGRILNNINVDCYIAGFKAAQEELYYKFGQFLIEEGRYYQHEFIEKRIESCGYSGIPLTSKHDAEFENAKEIGEMLEEIGMKIVKTKLLT